MPINNHWRNKQAGNNLLWQEIQCLEFLKRYPGLDWVWHGNKNSYFYDLCKQDLNIKSQGNAVVLINYPVKVSVDRFIKTLKEILAEHIEIAYLAVNRYEFIPNYTANCNDYPDQIEDCLDLIVSKCNKHFRRLYLPDSVDGKHFVGVHGLDVFVYENNNRLQST
jgi:hypothetical protein